MRKLKELRPGAFFKFAGLTWVKLDDLEEGCLAITKNVMSEAPFSNEENNNYNDSIVADWINIDLYNLFIEHGAMAEDLLYFSRDLTADDGTTIDINSSDVVSLITCEEYRKYRKLIPAVEKEWWTLTAESNHLTSNNTVKVISITGKITNRTATVASGVRPVCNINKEREVEEMPVTEKIKKWFVDRNLDTADPKSQMLKLMEETGELAEGIAKNRPDQIKDSIGDIYVVLTGLSIQLGYNIEECIEAAYEEIKDRKGKMIDGVFVKESDL